MKGMYIVQHNNSIIFGQASEETRFNLISWLPEARKEWEGGSSERCAVPLESLFSRIGLWCWPLPSCPPYYYLGNVGPAHKWVMELPSQPIPASVPIVRRWLSCYLATWELAARWSNFEESIIFADLDKGWRSNPRKFPICEYLCRSWKL